MTTIDSDRHVLAFTAESIAPDEAELAAIAFLARYSAHPPRPPGRHLESLETPWSRRWSRASGICNSPTAGPVVDPGTTGIDR